jgi:hypothetical protein
MPASFKSRAAQVDALVPGSGDVGYFILCDATYASLTFTVNTSTDVVTTSGAHNLVTGTRVRVVAATTQPNVDLGSGTVVLSATLDLFFRSVTSTTGTLHQTFADADGNTNAVDFIDSGSGTLTLNEQTLIGGSLSDAEADYDDITVWVNHEIDHPDYSRFLVTGVGSASVSTAQKPVYSANLSVNAPNGDLTFRHYVYLHGGTSTIGDPTCTWADHSTESANQTLSEGTAYTISLNFRGKNPTA